MLHPFRVKSSHSLHSLEAEKGHLSFTGVHIPRGGGGTVSLRVGTQNKTTDPRFCATTALSHCPCWFTAPCFQGIKGRPIVITVVTAACHQRTSFFSCPDTITLSTVAKTLVTANQGCFPWTSQANNYSPNRN